MTIVAFCWQGENFSRSSSKTSERVKIMIAAVRQNMPRSKLVHMTTAKFPDCPGVDAVFRHRRTGDFIEWSVETSIKLLEDTKDEILFIGTDVVIQRDVTHVFDLDFDVASCRYPDWEREDKAYCGDVTFAKPSGTQFLKDMLIYYRSHPDIKDGWEGGQLAFLAVAKTKQHNVLDLDFNTFCRTPESENEDLSGADIVHYRGPRKAWMEKRC